MRVFCKASPTLDQRPKGVNPAIAGMMHLIPLPLLLKEKGSIADCRLQIVEVKGKRANDA